MRKFSLRCLNCLETFTQLAPELIYDLGTSGRLRRGEKLPFSEFIVTTKVICPHCGAVDRYTVSGGSLLRVYWDMILGRLFRFWPDRWFQVVTLASQDGRIMHPFELRAWYADQVAKKPGDVKLRMRYANTLRSQGWYAEAEEQYGVVLGISPRQPEALVNLAALLAVRGEREAALETLRRLAAVKAKNKADREFVEAAQCVLDGTLPLDELSVTNPIISLR